MKKKRVFCALSAQLFLLTQFACHTDSSGEDESVKPKAQLSVQTRSTTNGGAPTQFPVHIYAFNEAGKCTGYQMLDDANEPFSFTLVADENYTLYALCGAKADSYILPDPQDVSATSPLVLVKDSAHSELEVGRIDIKLDPGEKRKSNIQTKHAVALLTAYLSDLPKNLLKVTLSFHPMQTVLRINGSYDETQIDETKLELVQAKRKGDWVTKDTMFILPSPEETSVTISVKLTTPDSTSTYSYGAPFRIKANYSYEILAAYIPELGSPDLSGTITSSDWEGDEKIVFGFNDTDGSHDGQVFRPGGFFKGRYILRIDTIEENRVDIYMLSSTSYWSKYVSPWKEPETDYEVFDENLGKILYDLVRTDYETFNDMLVECGIIRVDTARLGYIFKDEQNKYKSFSVKEPAFTPRALIRDSIYNFRGFTVERLKFKPQ